MNIGYFVSGHGFGHISRSFEIIKQILKLNHKVYLFTERERFLGDFKNENLTCIPLSTDVGMIQKESVTLDLTETKQQIIIFQKNKKNLINLLLNKLNSYNVSIIISDSSSLPFYLANQLGLPGYFIGNFTWDYIYNHYSKIDPFFYAYSEELYNEYKFAKLGLILPFHTPIESIPNKKYVGLIGRKPSMQREEIRKLYQFRDDITYILFSFGAYGINSNLFNFKNLPKNFQILTSGLVDFVGEGVRSIENIEYPNLLTACDFVITKPGYGILAESYFSNCSIIYTDRGDFIEYPSLVKAMQKYHNSCFISKEDLYNLNLEKTIEFLNQNRNKKRETIPDGMDEIIKTFLCDVNN